MHFCEKCNNMYYLKVADDDGDKLIYYCRNCGFEDGILTKDNICVLDTVIHQKTQRYKQVINEYTKHDPTLPRLNNIRCPNESCVSNTGAESMESGDEDPSTSDKSREVIYIRYDDINMKYIYMCVKCDTIWKTDENH